jgi:hypothetical protein
MADLSITTKATGGGDFRWLRTHHGRDNAIPVSIKRSLLTAGTHYDANGVVPSGLPLGKIAGQPEYGPYDPSAADGRKVLAGFLVGPEQLKADFSGVTTTVFHGAMVVDAIIDPKHVPTSPALTTATPTTGKFVFVDVEWAGPIVDVALEARVAALEAA